MVAICHLFEWYDIFNDFHSHIPNRFPDIIVAFYRWSDLIVLAFNACIWRKKKSYLMKWQLDLYQFSNIWPHGQLFIDQSKFFVSNDMSRTLMYIFIQANLGIWTVFLVSKFEMKLRLQRPFEKLTLQWKMKMCSGTDVMKFSPDFSSIYWDTKNMNPEYNLLRYLKLYRL